MLRFVTLLALVAAIYAAPGGKIVNGSDANIKDFPYQISIQYGVGRMQWCGGSVLNARHILTAAHCTEREEAGIFTIRAGSTDRTTGGQLRKVAQIIQHPDYDTKTTDFDVAILVLDEDLELNESVWPVKLWEDNQLPVGQNAWVTGWGDLYDGGSTYPETLQKLQVPILGDKECRKYIPDEDLTENMFCAGYVDGTADSCQGDSGGPLVLNGRQVGIVSWGYGCAQVDSPGIYARVSKLLDFIKTNAKL